MISWIVCQHNFLSKKETAFCFRNAYGLATAYLPIGKNRTRDKHVRNKISHRFMLQEKIIFIKTELHKFHIYGKNI